MSNTTSALQNSSNPAQPLDLIGLGLPGGAPWQASFLPMVFTQGFIAIGRLPDKTEKELEA